MNPVFVYVLGGSMVTLLGAVLNYCVRINKRQDEANDRLTKLETQIMPLWARVQAQISADLHRPHPRYFEMDKLLEKLEALTITDPERGRLKHLLLERSVDKSEGISQAQREKARLMVLVMDIVLLEASESPER
jgi:hypothetical protein